MKDLYLKTCPNCGSSDISIYKNSGVDLLSNFITNYFIVCEDCGTNIKSRNFMKMIDLWNSYEK